MKLNVEINAKTSWDDDKLRRSLKVAITDVINGTIGDLPYAELNSLRLYVPKPKRRVTRKKVEA
jgi:hypothetical protein